MAENGRMFGQARADSPLPVVGSRPAARGRLAGAWVGWVGAQFRRSWCVQGGEAKEEMRNRESRAMLRTRRIKRKERELEGLVATFRKEKKPTCRNY